MKRTSAVNGGIEIQFRLETSLANKKVILARAFGSRTKISAVHLTMRQCVKQSSLMVPLCWFRYTCSSGRRCPILLLALRLAEGKEKTQCEYLHKHEKPITSTEVFLHTYGSLFSCEPNMIMDFKAFQSWRTRSKASWANLGGSRS